MSGAANQRLVRYLYCISKTYYMVEAISEKLEDLEDLYLAEARTLDLKAGRSRTYTLDEVEKRLGLVD